MESGYDGLMRAEKKHGDKVKVTFVENVKFADMEQALTMLATKSDMVIGVGGQTQASVYKVAKRFPKMKFSIVGGNKATPEPNIAQYDVRQAEIAFMAGASAAMLSKTGGVSYVGGLEIPAIVNAGKEFGNGAKYVNPKIKYFESYTGDFDDVAKSKEATLAAIAQGADVHYHILNLGPARDGAGGAREEDAHHRQLHRSLRHRSALQRLQRDRRRLPGGVRHRPAGRRRLEAGVQAVRPEDGGCRLRHEGLRGAHAGAEEEAGGDQEGPPRRQDQDARKLANRGSGFARRTRAPGARARRDLEEVRGRPALEDVSLDVQAGEIHCLLGENGAGKRTLCNIVFGVHRARRGRAAPGWPAVPPARPRARAGVGRGDGPPALHAGRQHDRVENMLLGRARGAR